MIHYLSIDDLILLGVATTTSAVTIYIALRRRRELLRRSRETLSYDVVIGREIKGFVSGYLDSLGNEWFEVELSNSMVDEEFAGHWKCIKLGSGGWGTAYLLRRGNEYVVVKVPHGFEGIIERGEVPTVNERLLRDIEREAEVLSKLNHPHIIKLIGYSRKVPLIMYEFADYGTLEWQVGKGWRPSLKEVLLIGTQLADALRYIHSRGLVHGDVKAGNVFIVSGMVKLGDFSSIKRLLAVTSSESRWSYTPGWRAPEQVYSDLRREASRKGLEDRIDVYQLGNLILYLTIGKVLDGEDVVKAGELEKMLKCVEYEDLRELLKELLTPITEERLSASEAVKKLYKLYITTKANYVLI